MRGVVVAGMVISIGCYTSQPSPAPVPPTNTPPSSEGAPAQTFASPPPGATGTSGSSATGGGHAATANLSLVGPECQTCPPTAPACPIGMCADGVHQHGCGDCVTFANNKCGWIHLSCPATQAARTCSAADCSLPVPSAWLCPDGVTVTDYVCVPTSTGTCAASLRPCGAAARVKPVPPPRPPPAGPPPAPPNPHPCGTLPSVKTLATWPVQPWCDPCCGAAPPEQRVLETLADGTKIIEAMGKCMRVKYRVCSRNKCLPPDARIATPLGDMAVSVLRAGMPIWTRDDYGRRVAGVVTRVSSTGIDGEHRVARVLLADGRTLIASPEHPLADGSLVDELHAGDRYDGSTIVSIALELYTEAHTYDILPSGTGIYWADGVPVGSTLASRSAQRP